MSYVGRFAPSPSGPLHAGSVATALASYLDAKAARGRWLMRIEDLDVPRNVAGADRVILQQLQQLGMQWDGEVYYQSKCTQTYKVAFEQLLEREFLYPCGCTRKEIADSILAQHGEFPLGERPYPGACRVGLKPGRVAKSWRLRVDSGIVTFQDRWYGSQSQDVRAVVGDFVVKRADGQWAYQLAVVLDDAKQGVTHVVRGADLLTSTARQMQLGQILGLPMLHYMHIPVVMDGDGKKLSKQNGASLVDTSEPLVVLEQSWAHLGFATFGASDLQSFFAGAIERWSRSLRTFPLAPP